MPHSKEEAVKVILPEAELMLLALGLASEEFFAVYDKASRGTSSGAALPPVEKETPLRWAYTYAAKSCTLLLSHSPVDSMVVALQRATLHRRVVFFTFPSNILFY